MRSTVDGKYDVISFRFYKKSLRCATLGKLIGVKFGTLEVTRYVDFCGISK